MSRTNTNVRKDCLREWMDLLVESIRHVQPKKNIHTSPPHTARLFGLVGVSLYVAYQTLQRKHGSLLSEEHSMDGWEIGTRHVQYQELVLSTAWIEASIAVLFQRLGTDYLPLLSEDNIKALYHKHSQLSLQGVHGTLQSTMQLLSPWNPKTPMTPFEQTFVDAHNHYREQLQKYFDRRQEDGWKSAQRVPDHFPNQGVYIPVNNLEREETIDLNVALPDPDKYALLEIYDRQDSNNERSTKQMYLGPSFGNIDIESLYPKSKREELRQHMKENYPSEQQRRQEILNMREAPDDNGRVIAELWAGSFPGYCNPPTAVVWMTILWTHVQSTIGYEKMLLILINLCISLFVVATVCWDFKYDFLQPRPIQDMRRWYPQETVEDWTGVSTTGKHWRPYQESTFVTPPFPDFPSGHSCFSTIMCTTLYTWLQSDVANVPFSRISMSELQRLSPLLDNPVCSFFNGCSITIPPHCSVIDPGQSPSSAIQIPFTSWMEIMNMIGESRVTGGIHTRHTNRFSQILSDYIVNHIQRHFFGGTLANYLKR